ncbi:MAG: hypothetical protein IPP83_00885 [Flavobacteriales bacterium]|nr:hypothetical protein [Flavobacteriales bacterium]
MVSDITYWAVPEGFYYVFLITDVCSHKIMGHYLAQSLDGIHAIKALRMAIRESRHELSGQIHRVQVQWEMMVSWRRRWRPTTTNACT